ncbi:hypothetical protein [Rouxiella badensis]|uniref:hypothetical protein n=1 Tax=Rouxiella badensis TaxID=1646377 RepID=UPI001D143C44|nr:hypothetical protein [Rouxiella badensis]
MKLSKSEYNELTSSLEEFGKNSQKISSKFISLAKLFISEAKKNSEIRERVMLTLTEQNDDIATRINNLDVKVNSGEIIREEADEELKELKILQDKLKNTFNEIKSVQKFYADNMIEFKSALDVLGIYTESFKNDYLSSVKLIKTAEIDLDGK